MNSDTVQHPVKAPYAIQDAWSPVPVEERNRRLDEVRAALNETGFDALLVYAQTPYPGKITYLTGWTTMTDAWAVVTATSCDVVTGPYEYVRSGGECWLEGDHIHLVDRRDSQLGRVRDLLPPDARRLAFSGASVVPAPFASALENLTTATIEPVDLLAPLRSIKSSVEVSLLEQAYGVAALAAESFSRAVVPGQTEAQVAAAVETTVREAGANYFVFPTAVGAGLGALEMTMSPSQRQIMQGDLVMLDCAARVPGSYCFDMARAVVAGDEPSESQLKVIDTIQLMYDEAVALLKPGVDGREVFRRAEAIAADQGFEFEHEIGHGVGCDQHEYPSIDGVDQEVPLEAGMVVTIEPGLYVDGIGGARLENMFVIEEDGARLLNGTPTAEPS